ncbi:hypothetical protein JCM10449v2_003047 [Rhodotorula kratochvilovae]
MVSGSWANAGAGFDLGPTSSISKRTLSQASRPSQARSKSTSTQLRLRPPDKRPLVTPRASTSALKPSQKQSRLSFGAPASGTHRPLADKPNHPNSLGPSPAASDRKGKGRALPLDDDDEEPKRVDDTPAVPQKKPGWLSSIFRRTSTAKAGDASSSPSTSSRTPGSTSLGRAILDPTLRRRGPTIDFDADLPADDDELADEDARRKRRRTEDRGGWGRLDLCDSEVHAGFGTQREERADERRKRSLEMALDGANDAPRGSARSRSRTSQRVDVRPDSQPDEALPPPASAYFTARTSARALVLPSSSAGSDAPEPSTASSGSSAERSLQAQLVQPPPPVKRAPRVLVPDSDPPSGAEDALTEKEEGDDDDDELDALVARLGQKGAPAVDDSGFAEGGMDLDDDERGRALTPTPTKAADELDLTVIPSSSPLPAPALLGAPAAADEEDADNDERPSSGSLARTASAILMPPPALPRKRLRRGAPSSRAAAAEAEAEAAAAEQARVLVEDTQIRSPTRACSSARDESQPYAVLCDETQTQPPVAAMQSYRTLPRLPRPANLPGAGLLSSPSGAPNAPLSDPDHLPPLPTPRPLAVPLSPAPLAAGWASLAAAWAGARAPSPPAPAAAEARQTRLGEFFELVPASQADADTGTGTGVVEDSQCAAERSLEEALRAQLALNAARERACARMPVLAEEADEEDILDADADADAAEEVPDSDPEDDAPSAATVSPLGTPIKARFPRYSPGKMRRAVERFAAPAAAEGEREGGEETQWESYWSYPASSPAGEGALLEKLRASQEAEGGGGAMDVEADEDDEDDEEESLALPAGWTRGENGELVHIGEAGEADVCETGTAGGAASWEDTLTGW